MLHEESHPLAGQTVRIKDTVTHKQYPDIAGSDFYIEDWWDKVTGGSRMDAFIYAMRSVDNKLPTDNKVVYGHYGSMSVLLHVSEFDEIKDGG